MMGSERGQAAVEMALLVPVLVTLLMMVLEGGLFLGEYVSVVNSARESARYLLDGGSDTDLASLAPYNARGLATDPAHFDVWVIRGQTDSSGNVTFTSTTHPLGNGPAQPLLSAAAVQQRLAGSGAGTAANLKFIAVEVAYRHQGLTGTLALPSGALTLRADSLVRRL